MNVTGSAIGGSASGSAFGSAEPAEPEHDDSYDIGFSVVKIVLSSFGLFGNVLVILVILILKEYKKSVTNWYVLQLAIADLLFLATIPFKAKENIDGKWTWPVSMCRFNESLMFLNYNASILFLTVMSIDRYIYVCRNSSNALQKFRTKSAGYIATVVIWAVSLVLCTPIFMYSDVIDCRCEYVFEKHNSPREECLSLGFVEEQHMHDCLRMIEKREKIDCSNTEVDHWEELSEGFDSEMPQNESMYDYHEISSGRDNSTEYGEYDEQEEEPDGLPPACSYEAASGGWYAFVRFNFIGLFIIPFLAMLFCYSFIAKQMIQSTNRATSVKGTRNQGSTSSKLKRRRSKTERTYRRATFLCIAYVVLFAICWLPFHSVHMAKLSGINQSAKFCNIITAITILLVISNSVINPCLYNFIGKNFIKRLRSAAAAVKGRISSHSDSMSSTGFGVRYRRGNRYRKGSHSGSSVTASTKIYKGKSERESSGNMSSEANITQHD